MIQWIGLGLTFIGMVYNGYQQYRQTVPMQQRLTIRQPVVESSQPIRFYQATYDSFTGKFHVLGTDGVWYEQVPQIRTDQTQYPSPVGVAQGTQQPQVGQRIAQQPAQASQNPWLR